jgi:hypothetical protein
VSFAIDTIGWTGAGLLLIAFSLVSNNRLSPTGLGYQYLNIVGSLLLLSNNVYYGAYPSGFVNTVWTGVAAVALVHAGRKGTTS